VSDLRIEADNFPLQTFQRALDRDNLATGSDPGGGPVIRQQIPDTIFLRLVEVLETPVVSPLIPLRST
jgi:hypothetical protein